MIIKLKKVVELKSQDNFDSFKMELFFVIF
jgi:hypothetical protein